MTGAVTLPEPARLYVRAAGEATLAHPRRFLGEFLAGAIYLPLAADGVAFDLVSARTNQPLEDLEPCLPTAEQLAAWKLVVARFPCFADTDTDAEAPAAEDAAAIAQALAGWYGDRERRDVARRQAAYRDDAARMSTAYRRIAAVTRGWAGQRMATGTDADGFQAALQVIGSIDSFSVNPSPADEPGLPLDQRLERAALASAFRYRAVTLAGAWWRDEGPPLLVALQVTGAVRVAHWASGGYRLLDPVSGEVTVPGDGGEGTVAPFGYMFYAALPDEVTPDAVARFAFRQSGREIRATFLAGAVATMLGFLVPVATGAVVATAIPEGRQPMIWEMALAVAAAGLGVAGFSLGRSFATIRASSLINLRLQSAVWDRILRLPTRFFRDYSTGDLAQRVLGVDKARQILTGPVLNGLLSGVFAAASFVLMLIYDLRLALYGLTFAVLTGLVLAALARRQLVFTQAAQELKGRVAGAVIDMLTGVTKLRVAAAEERAFA